MNKMICYNCDGIGFYPPGYNPPRHCFTCHGDREIDITNYSLRDFFNSKIKENINRHLKSQAIVIIIIEELILNKNWNLIKIEPGNDNILKCSIDIEHESYSFCIDVNLI